ncbi:MAG: hypothetical protein ABIZ80_05700 [Bryobacteraceae bacterium]
MTLLRLPFLSQAIQGDDIYYLAGAEHAQIEPAHPNNVSYVFLGDRVDMSGHPHPPLNVWALGALLAAVGDIREVPFHAGYTVFSLLAAWSMWSLAMRFSPQPLWAALLFVATPAFVVNGSSLESDVPFVAFWLASIALFVGQRWVLAALAMVLASLAAYQAVLLTPILGLCAWLFFRRSRMAWMVVLVPPVAVAMWQGYELLSTGKLPVAVLAGHFEAYGFQAIANKLRNAAALGVHATWLVCPALLVPLVIDVRRKRDPETLFLLGWIAIFFTGAVAIFFAGSARYLLPMAAPVALLASRVRLRWLIPAFAIQMAISLSLAWVNYQHWNGYREFAASLRELTSSKRVWINGEWGLRYYFEADGGLALTNGQAVRPGEMVVSSELGFPVPFTTGGGVMTPIMEREITATLPLRLIALHTRSAYSTAINGYLPFDISSGPIDRVRAGIMVERQPQLSFLPMSAVQADQQIVSGVYALEGTTRWMSGRAVLLLKSPAAAAALHVRVFVPDQSPARRVTLLLDGEEVASKAVTPGGVHAIETLPLPPAKPVSTLTITVDTSFSVPGDRRELGVVLVEAGYQTSATP